jgi:hypothetical protein
MKTLTQSALPVVVSRLVRRLPILAFDAETESVAGCYCCAVAEEQAAIRYGKDWREDYRKSRALMRLERWPILSKLIPTNVLAQAPKGAK